mgnify:CR=1 FL=1
MAGGDQNSPWTYALPILAGISPRIRQGLGAYYTMEQARSLQDAERRRQRDEQAAQELVPYYRDPSRLLEEPPATMSPRILPQFAALASAERKRRAGETGFKELHAATAGPVVTRPERRLTIPGETFESPGEPPIIRRGRVPDAAEATRRALPIQQLAEHERRVKG